jgi:hypothetical protein
MKVPYVEDNPLGGGSNPPSDEDIGRIIRETVQSWQPRRGPDWPGVLMKVADSGPPSWMLYAAASAALVVILLAAFIVGSALGIGALAPQPIPGQIGH